MIVIETILGNIGNQEWSDRLATFELDVLEVDQWEAQKSRFRKMTTKGAEVAVSIDRGTYLRDGDVLLWDAQTRSALVARIEVRDVMILHLENLMNLAPASAMRTCVELGHALGNQHWPALVRGNLVYVPLTMDRKVMASVMDTHHFEGIHYEFVSGREVVPYLAPHESRRLFGGAEGPVHSHTHESYALTDTETGQVYGRSPVRIPQHPKTDPHAHGSPGRRSTAHSHGE